jgi:hypothetical protein
MDVTFTLVQTGAELTGLWNTTGGSSGGVTGVLAESGIPGLTIRQVNPCAGEFVGIAVVEAAGNRLRGSYVGDDCTGRVTASFVVNRQLSGAAPAAATPGTPAGTSAPTNQATAEWECRRDVAALTANSRYAVWGPLWWNLWQGHEKEEQIKDSRALLFNSCMRAKGF